jgi:hypothetical protein
LIVETFEKITLELKICENCEIIAKRRSESGLSPSTHEYFEPRYLIPYDPAIYRRGLYGELDVNYNSLKPTDEDYDLISYIESTSKIAMMSDADGVDDNLTAAPKDYVVSSKKGIIDEPTSNNITSDKVDLSSKINTNERPSIDPEKAAKIIQGQMKRRLSRKPAPLEVIESLSINDKSNNCTKFISIIFICQTNI